MAKANGLFVYFAQDETELHAGLACPLIGWLIRTCEFFCNTLIRSNEQEGCEVEPQLEIPTTTPNLPGLGSSSLVHSYTSQKPNDNLKDTSLIVKNNVMHEDDHERCTEVG